MNNREIIESKKKAIETEYSAIINRINEIKAEYDKLVTRKVELESSYKTLTELESEFSEEALIDNTDSGEANDT